MRRVHLPYHALIIPAGPEAALQLVRQLETKPSRSWSFSGHEHPHASLVRFYGRVVRRLRSGVLSCCGRTTLDLSLGEIALPPLPVVTSKHVLQLS